MVLKNGRKVTQNKRISKLYDKNIANFLIVFCNFAAQNRKKTLKLVISYGKESTFDDSRRMGNR